jgi:FAD:protein FMN transferase
MTVLRREIDVWGTVIVVEVASATLPETFLAAQIDSAATFFEVVDRDFSPFKSDSEVSRLMRGEIDIASCSAAQQEVWSAIVEAKRLTNGAFDPWALANGYDPSGYVKGWAADKAADTMIAAGVDSVLINAGGDVAVRNVEHAIGIRHPDQPLDVVHEVSLSSGAVATSGTYAKGAHIWDPRESMIAIGARSATVWGPDGGLADALATALVVAGPDGASWFAQPELRAYSAYVINRHEESAWTVSGADFSQ